MGVPPVWLTSIWEIRQRNTAQAHVHKTHSHRIPHTAHRTPHTAHRTPTRKHGSTWTGFAAGYRDRVVSDPRSPFRGPRNQSQPGSKSTGPPTRNSEEPYFLSDTACAVLGSRHVSVPALVGARTFMRLRWRRASGAHHSRPEFVAQSVNCEFGISAAVFRLTKK